MDKIAHPLEVCFSKQLGHRRRLDSGWLWYEQGMIAFLVTTAVIAVMLPVIGQKSSFSIDRTGGGADCVPWAMFLAPIESRISYIGISDVRADLFHINKSLFGYCTSDSLPGIILP